MPPAPQGPRKLQGWRVSGRKLRARESGIPGNALGDARRGSRGEGAAGGRRGACPGLECGFWGGVAASGKKDPERERRRAGAASPEFSISTRRWQLRPEGLEAAGPALRQVNAPEASASGSRDGSQEPRTPRLRLPHTTHMTEFRHVTAPPTRDDVADL